MYYMENSSKGMMKIDSVANFSTLSDWDATVQLENLEKIASMGEAVIWRHY